MRNKKDPEPITLQYALITLFDDQPVIAFVFRYNAEIVELIKTFVPPHARRYWPSIRAWFVREDLWPDLRTAIAENGVVKVEIVEDAALAETVRVHHLRATIPAPAWSALFLLPTAPPEVVRAAHAALAASCSGNPSRLQLLDQARDVILGALQAPLPF